MRSFFIEARLNNSIILSDEHLSVLPAKVGLAASVQHVHRIGELKKQIESSGREAVLLKGFHSLHEGQTLGCDFPTAVEGVDAVVFVGTGKFHSLGLLKAGKAVFISDPVNMTFHKADLKEHERHEKRRKAAALKFLHSTEIGVLVSTKPGQLNLNAAEALKGVFREKNFYFLLFDTVDFSELENFPFIECYVNTACPRIMDDYGKFPKPVINLVEVLKLADGG
ncbi:diphthamide synthesis protein [Candidatus Woesearchaeota archaeon]|nr:diphthamide synthesis protein [Candidatus Woesearchaeota archaeon]